MRDLSRIRVTGPLEPYVSGFVAELMEHGYTPVSAAHQLRLMAHVSRWLALDGFGPDDLSPGRVEQFVAARRDAGYVNYVTPRALVALVGHLRDLGVAPPAGELSLSEVEELLGRYRAWLCSERGLACVTARNYSGMVRPFVATRVNAAGELDLRTLAAGDVLAFVLAQCPHRRPGSAKLLVTALRSLLGYLHVEGVIARPLAPVVPSVAGWRLAGLPRGLGAEQVTALLDSCDLETAVGVMLVGLGAHVLWRMWRDRVHFHKHRHGDGTVHFHAHSHRDETAPHAKSAHAHAHGFRWRTLLVGLMHGVAGTAAMLVLAAS